MDSCLLSSAAFGVFTKFYEEIIIQIQRYMYKCIGRVHMCTQTHMFIFYISFSQYEGNTNFI